MYPDDKPMQFMIHDSFNERMFLDFEDRETMRYIEMGRKNETRRPSSLQTQPRS